MRKRREGEEKEGVMLLRLWRREEVRKIVEEGGEGRAK